MNQEMNQDQLNELHYFFNHIINMQIATWKTSNICISADYSRYQESIKIVFIGNNEERLSLDINIHTGFFGIPKKQEEFRDDFFLLGKRNIKFRRYTICCKDSAQTRQVLEQFNAIYHTQFEYKDA